MESVDIAIEPNSHCAYIFFGGFASGLSIPRYEFYKSASILNSHKVFLIDSRRSWYQQGLHGHTDDVDSTVDYISSVIYRLDVEKVTLVGNSMGGYAAILFCHLLGNCRAIAFSPQTYICPKLKIRNSDYRWTYPLMRVWVASYSKRKYWDLRTLLHESTDLPSRARFSIHASSLDKLDLNHARHLSGVSGVDISLYGFGGHSLVRELRDRKLLQEILQEKYLVGTGN